MSKPKKPKTPPPSDATAQPTSAATGTQGEPPAGKRGELSKTGIGNYAADGKFAKYNT